MKKKITIGIGSDHAGYDLKSLINDHLLEEGYAIKDVGPNSTESTDYPDYAHPVAQLITNAMVDFGILICGSGNGIGMTANKHNDVRAALCWNREIAELARKHNNANILALPARFINEKEGKDIVMAFIKTEFEGGRHQGRVDKINKS